MIIDSAVKIGPRLLKYFLARNGLIKSPGPMLLNFSVTNKCQSKCNTCNIWRLYKESPEKEKEELTIDEIEKVFKSMDNIFLLNICGGEPFLRDDLDQICYLASKYIKPRVIHSPTNCLAPERIENLTRSILQKIPSSTDLTIKLSLDGIGEKHDKIRGVKGNFKKVVETHNRLLKLREEYKNLYVDAGTTVSSLNLNDLKEIEDYVKTNFKLDSFLHEIADTRAELFNIDRVDYAKDEDFKKVTKNLYITPTDNEYAKVAEILSEYTKKDMKGKRALSRIVQAMRLVYYKRTAKMMQARKRIVTCYAGVSNCHLNPWGGLWLCNVQAFKHPMGNVRDFNYDFKALWNSQQAKLQRKWVTKKHCYCPLGGQAFLDTVLSPKELLKALWYYIK